MTKLSDIYSNFFLGVDYVKVSDVKAYDVGGGTLTAGDWRTRDINTEDADASGICSISSNQITLEAGTYFCSIKIPAYLVDNHVPRLYNISDSEVTIGGQQMRADSAYNVGNFCTIVGQFTIATEKTFEVQHKSTATYATYGMGARTNISDAPSIYVTAEFWRVAT